MQLLKRMVNFGVSCSLGESPQRGGGAEFYNLFSDEKVSGGAGAQKLSTRDKTGDLVSGHSQLWMDRSGPMPIIGLPSSQARLIIFLRE